MRHGTTNRRQRNRGGSSGGANNGGGARRSSGGQNNRMQVFDSNGPDVRIRGTAYQVHEKYAALAKDAASAGDRVLAESYLQHAEHYQRIINTWDDGVREVRVQSEEVEVVTSVSGDAQEDDLSLPASILMGSSHVTSQAVMVERTPEVAAE